MQEIFADISWTGVVAGAVVSFLLGWIWYSPKAFGTKWAEGLGVDLASSTEMPMAAMALQIVGLLLMSWFVGVTAKTDALLTVILATLAFTILAASGNLFGKTSKATVWVNAGYWIAALVVMIISQGIFRGMNG